MSSWRFVPTSAHLTTRYGRTARVKVDHRAIPKGLFSSSDTSRPTYLPPLWDAYIHPEGNVYFMRTSYPRVVTDTWLYDPSVFKQIEDAAQAFEPMYEDFPSVSSRDTEVFLRVTGEHVCEYYLIDHSVRGQFWLQELLSGDVSLPQTQSEEHLRICQEFMYWQHVEQFPSHHDPDFWLGLSDLISIFAQARVDLITSTTSTFPYSIEEINAFTQSIESVKGQPVSSSSVWLSARIWVNIVEHRFISHWSLSDPRLDSCMSILDIPVPARTYPFLALDVLGFRTPETYLHQLNYQFVDNMAYFGRWRNFVSGCHQDWKTSLAVAFAILISNLLLLISPLRPPTAISATILLLCMSAIGTAAVYLMQLGMAEYRTASEAANFLDRLNFKFVRFQVAAVLFSLPRVFTLWALLISLLEPLFIALDLRIAGLCIAGVAGLGLLCMCVCSAPTLWRRLRAVLRQPSSTYTEEKTV